METKGHNMLILFFPGLLTQKKMPLSLTQVLKFFKWNCRILQMNELAPIIDTIAEADDHDA